MVIRPDWQDVGDANILAKSSLVQVNARETPIALSWRAGVFRAISGVCNHLGGPLSEGTMDGDYVTCPWHYAKFHRATGRGEPGREDDRVPAYSVKIVGGRVLVDLASATPRQTAVHWPDRPVPLEAPAVRRKGPIRVVGVSTTPPTPKQPLDGTSDALLDVALEHAATLGAVARSIRLRDSRSRGGAGRYSESAMAGQWPCSIRRLDRTGRREQLYEALVDEADVIVVATPVRRGSASDLYYRMVERLNGAHARQATEGRPLMKRKVAGFIVTGGHDNARAVAGQMLGSFAELGCQFPAYPFVAHGRDPAVASAGPGTSARPVADRDELRDGARGLAARTIGFAKVLLRGAAL